MVIFSVERMMNQKKKIPINRFLRKDLNFQMIQALITLKKKESQRGKILMKIK
jgi:hypothetical protein